MMKMKFKRQFGMSETQYENGEGGFVVKHIKIFAVLVVFFVGVSSASAGVVSSSGVTVIAPPIVMDTHESDTTAFLFAEKAQVPFSTSVMSHMIC